MPTLSVSESGIAWKRISELVSGWAAGSLKDGPNLKLGLQTNRKTPPLPPPQESDDVKDSASASGGGRRHRQRQRPEA